MEKIKEIRIKKEDGTLSDILTIAPDADVVGTSNGSCVQCELDKLINSTSNSEKDIQNMKNKENDLQNQIKNLASGSPLKADSISDMTDTKRIYVLSTDGNWYYYDGYSWQIGGVYQSKINDYYWAYVTYNGIIDIIEKIDNSGSVLLYIEKDINIFKNGNLYQQVLKNLISEKFKTKLINRNNKEYLKLNMNECLYFNIAERSINISLTSQISNFNDIVILLNNSNSNASKGELYKIWLKHKTSDIYYTYISNNGMIRIFDDETIAPNCYFRWEGYIQLYKNNELKGSYSWDGIKNKFPSKIINSGGLEYLTLSQNECFYVNLIDNTSNINTFENIKQEHNILILLANGNNNVIGGELYSIWLKQITKYKYYSYISFNKRVDIVEESTIAPNIYLYAEDSIHIKRNGYSEDIALFTWDNLIKNFQDKVVDYKNKKYLSLGNNECLYFDLVSRTIKINSFSSINDYNNIVILLYNTHNNAIMGELHKIWLKFKSDGQNKIFNSIDYLESLDIVNKCADFSNEMAIDNTTNIESYIFFTDPHLMGSGSFDNSKDLEPYIGTLQKVYNSTPSNFIVCGGDWLNENDTDKQAFYKLGYINGFTSSMFKNFYNVIGNHDIRDDGTQSTMFSNEQVINLLLREQKKCYYKFNGINSINYVLDNSKYSNENMNNYKWEQIDWLANELINDDPNHSTIFTHIIINPSTRKVVPFIDNVTKLLDAFNNHTSIVLNNKNYNFTGKRGHVDYIIGGHTHYDWNDNVNGIPCIITRSFYRDTTEPTFDFIVNNYENNTVKLLRFGAGENREINI